MNIQIPLIGSPAFKPVSNGFRCVIDLSVGIKKGNLTQIDDEQVLDDCCKSLESGASEAAGKQLKISKCFPMMTMTKPYRDILVVDFEEVEQKELLIGNNN